jgi:hypothetical protein
MIIDKEREFELSDGRKLMVSKEDQEAIFKGLRPRSLDYNDFIAIKNFLNREAKKHKKGTLVHQSKVSDELWDKYIADMEFKPKQRGNTYVKKRESEGREDI